MEELATIILYTLGAGACIPLGGVLAGVERVRPDWLENELRYFIIAFGGGVLLAAAGWAFLADHAVLLGAIMLFASGGILYLIFQDIAPQSRMQRHWAPPLGAVLGFALGMLGASLTGGV